VLSPGLNPDAQVAMTLREICGLTTEQVAAAFLTNAPTLAQRIVRAKAKIRDAKIPYEIPERTDLPERLASVLHVVYLVFNQGYFTRADLATEAIRLGGLLVNLLPEAEAIGLLALMLLHDARRATRTNATGAVIELNRAAAIAMRDGPEHGLKLIDAILARGDLQEYHLAHAARADLFRRLGRKAEARAAYERALALAVEEPERRLLERRLREL